MNSLNRILAVVWIPKYGVLRHVGLLLPNGLIVHCAPNCGEHLTTPEEFAGGKDVTIDYVVPPEHWNAVLARVNEALRCPRPYHALENNCEMFVNRVLTEQAASPQLRAVVGILALVALGKIAASG